MRTGMKGGRGALPASKVRPKRALSLDPEDRSSIVVHFLYPPLISLTTARHNERAHSSWYSLPAGSRRVQTKCCIIGKKGLSPCVSSYVDPLPPSGRCIKESGTYNQPASQPTERPFVHSIKSSPFPPPHSYRKGTDGKLFMLPCFNYCHTIT